MTDVRWTSAHQRARKRAHELFVPGTPCRYCHRPMLSGQRLHLDHVVPVALGGANGPTTLVHARCNLSAGATLGNRMRKSGHQAGSEISQTATLVEGRAFFNLPAYHGGL